MAATFAEMFAELQQGDNAAAAADWPEHMPESRQQVFQRLDDPARLEQLQDALSAEAQLERARQLQTRQNETLTSPEWRAAEYPEEDAHHAAAQQFDKGWPRALAMLFNPRQKKIVREEALYTRLESGVYEGLPRLLRIESVYGEYVHTKGKAIDESLGVGIGDSREAAHVDIVHKARIWLEGVDIALDVNLKLLWACPLYAKQCDAAYRRDIIAEVVEDLEERRRLEGLL